MNLLPIVLRRSTGGCANEDAVMSLAEQTALSVPHNPLHFCLRLLSCVRLSEVLVLQGTPLLGSLFAMENPRAANSGAVALLTAGSLFLIAHVFVLNDWAGMNGDLRDPNRQKLIFTCRGVTPKAVACLSIILLLASLLLLSRIGFSTLVVAIALAALSALYSFPGLHFKGIPVLNSVLHFVGGVLHFLLGYSVFGAIDWRGIEIGSFFALVFVAGHLTHETRDSDSDRQNEIKTNAVTFGKTRSFLAALALFMAADLLLMMLALGNIVPCCLALVILIFPIHAYWSWRTIRAGLTFSSVHWLQQRYRLLYAFTGLWMVAAVLLQAAR